MSKNILIFLNTDYHFETALSIYKSIELFGYNPYILLDFGAKTNDYEAVDFLKKYKIKFILPEDFDKFYSRDFFYKMFIITASHNGSIPDKNETSPPINYNHRMKLLKDKAILIYHRADFSEYLKYIDNYFINPKAISVTQYSQQFNLDYLYQVENPLEEISYYKKEINDPLELIIIGRFNLQNRGLTLLNDLPNIDKEINKKIKINLMGQAPNKQKLASKLINLNEYTFQNIEINYLYNLSQIEFYKKIMDTDIYINNLSSSQYIKNRFSSNLQHIISFAKPNISPTVINLVYNIPSVTYINVDGFAKEFTNFINTFTATSYNEIQSQFTTVKQNLRSHNNMMLGKLFS